jgi:hypothetical protein
MSSLSSKLCDTNHRLRFWLDSMVSGPGQPAITTPEHLAALLSELLRAGTGLRAEPLPAKGQDPELDAELENYRTHVEQLRELLPGIHSQLLAERARLEAQRTRVQSAAEWARASRQTL